MKRSDYQPNFDGRNSHGASSGEARVYRYTVTDNGRVFEEQFMSEREVAERVARIRDQIERGNLAEWREVSTAALYSFSRDFLSGDRIDVRIYPA